MYFAGRFGCVALCATLAVAIAASSLIAADIRPFPISSTIPSSFAPAKKATSPAAADTAYFSNDVSAHLVGLKYTGVLAAVFFIVDGNIVPTSLLNPPTILGWAKDGPYTNILIAPPPGPADPYPAFGTGPLFSYTGTGKIVWAEAADTSARLVPVEYPGGAYHGCGWQWSGNVDCDPSQLVDIADLTRLIDYLFVSRDSLCCEGEANCDGSPGIDLGDVTRLIDYLFVNRTPPAPCR